MKKIYIILPDNIPYSLCAKSFVNAFRQSGFFVEKDFSSQLDIVNILNFNPDIVMCFDFSDLKDGFLTKIYENNKNCLFIFNFLKALNKNQDKKYIENLNSFEAKKIVLTADKSNLKILPKAKYMPNAINYKLYKTFFKGYSKGITLLSNPDNINVLNLIIDLIKEFGKITFYADEIEYVKSLDNELWSEVNDEEVKNLYKQSYQGDLINEKSRAKVLSESFITIVPVTGTPNGIDFRILEACASSGFVICEETPETVRLFEVGKEIETYKTKTELTDKIRLYLKFPSFARNIADNGRIAVVNNHSVFDEVKKISSLIKKESEKQDKNYGENISN